MNAICDCKSCEIVTAMRVLCYSAELVLQSIEDSLRRGLRDEALQALAFVDLIQQQNNKEK